MFGVFKAACNKVKSVRMHGDGEIADSGVTRCANAYNPRTGVANLECCPGGEQETVKRCSGTGSSSESARTTTSDHVASTEQLADHLAAEAEEMKSNGLICLGTPS